MTKKSLENVLRNQLKIGSNTKEVLKNMHKILSDRNIKLYGPIGFDINNFFENFTITNDTNFSAGDIINVSLGIIGNDNLWTRTTFCVPFSIFGKYLAEKAKEVFDESLREIKAGSRYIDISRAIELSVKKRSLGTIRNIYGYNMVESKYIIPNVVNIDTTNQDYYSNISEELKVGDVLYVVIPLSSDSITQDGFVYPHGIIFTINPKVNPSEFKLSKSKQMYNDLLKDYNGKFFTGENIKDIVEKYAMGKSSEAYLKDLFTRQVFMDIQSLYLPIEKDKQPTLCVKYGRTIKITEEGYELL